MQNNQPSTHIVEKTFSNSPRKGAHQVRYELRRNEPTGLFIAVIAGNEPVEQLLVYADEAGCQEDWSAIVSGKPVEIDDLNWTDCIDAPLAN